MMPILKLRRGDHTQAVRAIMRYACFVQLRFHGQHIQSRNATSVMVIISFDACIDRFGMSLLQNGAGT